MSRPFLPGRMSLYLALGLLSAACWDFDTPSQGGADPGCETNAECPTGLDCQSGTCVSATTPSWSVRLRFLPGGQAISAAAEVEEIDFRDTGPVRELGTIRLPGAQRLVVRVRTEDGEQLAVRATARVVSDDNSPLVYAGENLEDVTDPRLSLEIPRAWPTADGGLRPVIYDLLVWPKDERNYPPWLEAGFRVPDVGSAAEILLPGIDARLTVEGRVALSESNPSPISGMSVFAVDADGHTVSSRTETDDNGRFTLFFWPNAEPQIVSLKVMRTVESGPLPGLTKSIQVPLNDQSGFLTLYLGDFGPVIQAQGEVIGLDIDGNKTPVTGAALRFVAQVGEGTYRIDVPMTDGNGRFDVPLYASDYRVFLIPHIGSPYRLTATEVSMDNEEPMSFTVDRKVAVRGSIVQPDGQPIALARVTSRLRSWHHQDAEVELAVPTRSQNSQTALDGTFALQLDAGVHELVIQPDPRTGLPASQHLVTIPETEAEVQVGTFTIPAGAVLNSVLLGPDEGPAAGVVVEAWRELFGIERRLGWAVSDETGRLRLRLPATE